MSLSHCNAPMHYDLSKDEFTCPVCSYRATSAEAATEPREPPKADPSVTDPAVS